MATNVPAPIKAADLARFAVRAAQLEKFNPVVSYWCNYWIVNQILARSLHQTDDECLEYTTTLMDKLEQTRQKHADNPAMTNDEAGKTACMSLAEEVFGLAEKALDANRVTKKTVDQYQAAYTFFQLAQIWGDLDPETAAKIKWAKFNAGRIFQDIRQGKDPNESNPRRKKQDQGSELPALDPNDPEVQMLMGGEAGGVGAEAPSTAAPAISLPSSTTSPPPPPPPQQQQQQQRYIPPMPRPVTIEDVPDRGEQRVNSAGVSPLEPPPAPVSAPTSPIPSNMPSAPDQVSPLAPPEQPDPTQGSYFPSMQSPASAPSHGAPPPPHLPKVAANPAGMDYYRTTPSQPTPPRFADSPPQPVQAQQTTGAAPYPPPTSHAPSRMYHSPPALPASPPMQHHQHHHQPAPPAQATALPPAPDPQSHHTPYGQQRYTTSDRKMAEAQKHAKWAISALNFEDVSTAVKELRIALDQLLE